jgi:hypothetical protein
VDGPSTHDTMIAPACRLLLLLLLHPWRVPTISSN